MLADFGKLEMERRLRDAEHERLVRLARRSMRTVQRDRGPRERRADGAAPYPRTLLGRWIQERILPYL